MNIYPLYPNLEKIKNNGEEVIYKLIREINLSDNKNEFSIHTLDITGDRKRLWYEIDFLIFSPRGIIVIEVKGSPLRKLSGNYYQIGNLEPTKQSPLHQVSMNRSKFYEEFASKYLKGVSKEHLVPIVILCENENIGFPDQTETLDLKKNYTAFKEDIKSASSFKNFLNKALDTFNNDYLKSRVSSINTKDIFITNDNLLKSKKMLRPEVDFGISASEYHGKLLHKLTEEQYSYADITMNFERVIFEGGAGTGKTFLAIYIAKCWSNLNYKTAFITSSKYFNNILSETLNEKVDIAFTLISADNLLKGSKLLENQFDRIVIDEGQQLCNEEYLNKLEYILKGGLSKGIWRWFGDPQLQIIDEGLFNSELYELLKEYTGNSSTIELINNVRNTKKIFKFINSVNLHCGKSSKAISEGFGPEIEYLEEDMLITKVRNVFKEANNYNNYNLKVALLHTKSFNDKSIIDFCKKVKISPYHINKENNKNILISSIEDYRGLEADLVIIFGLDMVKDDSLFLKLLYLSLTRSKAYVFFLVSDINKFYNKLDNFIK